MTEKQVKLGRDGYVKTVITEDWIIGYHPRRPGLHIWADFHRNPPNVRLTPCSVTDYYCGICKADEHEPCKHIKALVANAPGMEQIAEPDIDDRREAYYQAGELPPYPIY